MTRLGQVFLEQQLRGASNRQTGHNEEEQCGVEGKKLEERREHSRNDPCSYIFKWKSHQMRFPFDII